LLKRSCRRRHRDRLAPFNTLPDERNIDKACCKSTTCEWKTAGGEPISQSHGGVLGHGHEAINITSSVGQQLPAQGTPADRGRAGGLDALHRWTSH